MASAPFSTAALAQSQSPAGARSSGNFRAEKQAEPRVGSGEPAGGSGGWLMIPASIGIYIVAFCRRPHKRNGWTGWAGGMKTVRHCNIVYTFIESGRGQPQSTTLP